MAGGRIDVEVAADLGPFNEEFESGLASAGEAATNFAGIVAGAVAVAGVGLSFASVIDTGNTFTKTLNEMSGVSQATGAQMDAIKTKAKELGNDVELSATSANDAAAAMTELSKGGFSVDQSMSAAKGTLQLAAAAQIDAAEAATIQSQALQAFGLDATYAATAADVLANTANASSSEITDVAAGLQQSGAVANQFGLTLEETAATLGVLANAGITGSDAGTLLKSTLLSLTDTSKPAVAAMDTLGLSVYDAQGNFVGMESLFAQLKTASGELTPEIYQQASATLFGSDAMRLSGVAAEQGSAGWNTMREAVGRQGAAAELAAAQNQGLPGVFERMQNTSERLQLQLYDLIDGPLASLGNSVVGLADGALDRFDTAMGNSNGAASGFGDMIAGALAGVPTLGGAFESLVSTAQPIRAMATDIGGALQSLGEGAMSSGGSVEILQGSLAVVTGTVSTLFTVLQPVVSIVSTAATAFGALPGPIQAVATGLVAMKLASMATSTFMARNVGDMGRMATAAHGAITRIQAAPGAIRTFGGSLQSAGGNLRAFATLSGQAGTGVGRFAGSMQVLATGSGSLSRIGQSFVTASTGASRFGTVVGTANAAATGFKAAAGGMMSALGGPAMIGIVAATVAISSWVGNVKEADQLTKQYEESLRRVAQSQSDMYDVLATNGGKIDDSVLSKLADQVNGVSEAFDSAAKNDAKWNNVASDMIGDVIKLGDSSDDISKSMDEVALANRQAKQAIDDTGMSTEQIARAVGGSIGEWETFRRTLIDSGEGGRLAAEKMDSVRQTLIDQQEAVRRVTPGSYELADAFRMLGDEAASADDKSSALKRALDALAGVPPDLEEAMSTYNEVVRSTAESTIEAWDASKGWGDALLKQNGSVDTQTANGEALRQKLLSIRNATADVATSGGDMGAALAKNEEQFQQLANATGTSVEQIQNAAKQLGYNSGAFTLSAQLNNVGGVTAELGTIKTMLDSLEPGKPKVIQVKTLTDDARDALQDLGVKVDEIVDPKTNVRTFKISADTGLASTALDGLIQKLLQTGGIEAIPRIDADTTSFIAKNQDAITRLGEIDRTTVSPEIGALIDDFLNGRDVTLAELQKIDSQVVDPKIRADIQEALINAAIVNKEIDNAARPRTATVTIDAVRTAAAQAAFSATGQYGPAAPVFRAFGGPIEGGTPGRDSVPVMAMPGEHMLTTQDVDNLGGQDGVFRFRAALAQGRVGRFADGGAIGSDGLDNMINFARAKSGIGYNYGPWDCSMYMSHIAATGMGQQPRRLWTTYSILGGDLQGMQPGGSEGHFRIGVSEEHMAGTLFLKDGSRIDVENGGSNSGSTFGGNAAGYDDAQFSRQFFLPDAALNPALQMSLTGGNSYATGASKDPWTEKDALALESARVSVIQAKEAQDKVNANEKKTDADRQQAELKVQRAELKVRELEQKRDGTGSGAMIGPAPELAGSMTDDAISLRNAEIAVVDAQLARDKVYADVTSSSIDKEKADMAVYSAENALTKAKTEGSGDGQAFNLKDRAKKFGTDVVGILVDAAFEQLPSELSESRWITTDWEGLMGIKPKPIPAVAAPSFSTAEIQAQLPVTPGVAGWQDMLADINGDNWQERLAAALSLPTVLRDNGGPVPHGTAALNLSGAEEWMLTADERLNLSRDFALMRGAVKGGDGATQVIGLDALAAEVRSLAEKAGDTFNITTRDVEENARRVRQIQNTRALGAGSRF